jgi:hypothetical protein
MESTTETGNTVFFSPSAMYCSAIDIVHPNGRGVYSGKTLEEMLAKYPDIQIVPYEVSIAHDKQQRITAPAEISYERFDDLLNVLPPCKWRRLGGAEAFHMVERITHDIVTWCVRIGEKCYSFDDTDKLTTEQAIEKVRPIHQAH